jgi:hypothetical protein
MVSKAKRSGRALPKVNAPQGNAMPPAVLAAVLFVTLTLSACSSTLSELPHQVGGLPEGTPQRPAEQAAYPAVHDMPAARPTTAMSDADRQKAEAELAAARAAQAKRVEAAARND